MYDRSRESYTSAGATKAQTITKLLRCNKGASLAELMKATGWQAHSLRGFIAGTLKKKSGRIIRSSREEGRQRRYFLEGEQA